MNKFTSLIKNIFGLVNIWQDRHLCEICSSFDSTWIFTVFWALISCLVFIFQRNLLPSSSL